MKSEILLPNFQVEPMPRPTPRRHCTYAASLLKPSRAVDAEAHNAPLLGDRTLGVEVTEPDLAARCELGNIDPQHAGCDSTSSAIEAAMSFPLPDCKARLVTIRPDADAIGAMAVLALRRSKADFKAGEVDRIRLIGAADRWVKGSWPGPSKGPLDIEQIDDVLEPHPAIMGLRDLAADHRLSVHARVCLAMDWIAGGDLPALFKLRARARIETTRRAFEDGEITVRPALDGLVALVRSENPSGLALGYSIAPVVVAIGGCEGPGRKMTIAQWGESWIDLPLLAARLNRFEPGWGGSATIIGSPQGIGSQLSLSRVLEMVNVSLLAFLH